MSALAHCTTMPLLICSTTRAARVHGPGLYTHRQRPLGPLHCRGQRALRDVPSRAAGGRNVRLSTGGRLGGFCSGLITADQHAAAVNVSCSPADRAAGGAARVRIDHRTVVYTGEVGTEAVGLTMWEGGGGSEWSRSFTDCHSD